MNRTVGLTVAAAAGLIVALAGCNGGHGKVKSDLSSASANPAVVQAEAKVKNCVALHLVQGKAAILACIAPAGSKQATEQALQADLAAANLTTKAGRAAFELAAAQTVVKNG